MAAIADNLRTPSQPDQQVEVVASRRRQMTSRMASACAFAGSERRRRREARHTAPYGGDVVVERRPGSSTMRPSRNRGVMRFSGEVACSEDGAHAGISAGRLPYRWRSLCRWRRRANRHRIEHSRQVMIRSEPRRAGDFQRAVDAGAGLADMCNRCLCL